VVQFVSLEAVMNASEVKANKPWERCALKWIVVLISATVAIAVRQPILSPFLMAVALMAVPKVRPESNSNESFGGKIRRFVFLCLLLLLVISGLVSSATGVDYQKWLKPVYLYALIGLVLIVNLAGDIRFLLQGKEV
jgi:hypothetical protein